MVRGFHALQLAIITLDHHTVKRGGPNPCINLDHSMVVKEIRLTFLVKETASMPRRLRERICKVQSPLTSQDYPYSLLATIEYANGVEWSLGILTVWWLYD